MLRFRLILLLVLSWASLRSAPAEFPGTDDKWQHYQSPNFELYSRNGETESRELLHNLELLHAVFFDTLKLRARRRTEVTVYYFKQEKNFRPYLAETYGPKNDFDGLYVGGIDRAVILLYPGQDMAATRQMIFHEYVHHMFQVAELNPPPWLNEGMAELFSTIVVNSDKVEIGKPQVGRLWQINNESLMPFGKLFAVDRDSPIFRQGEHTGLFYAESWALMHYLYFGDSKIPPQKRKIFLERAMTGGFQDAADMLAGFQEVFGMDYPEMQRRLERYVSGSGRYFRMNSPLPGIPSGKTYAKRSVPLTEIRLRLAELAFRISQSPLGKLALLQAKDAASGDARPLEALGAAAYRENDQQTMRDRWTRAAELGTRNPAIYRELGLMEGRTFFNRFDVYFRLPEEAAARLRGYLLQAIKYNPEQSDTYEMLAWVEAFAPEPSIKNLNLVQRAYPALSRKERTTLALAFARLRLNHKDDALVILADLEAMQPDPWEVYGIEAIRAYIEKRPIRRENLRPAEPSTHGRMTTKPGG